MSATIFSCKPWAIILFRLAVENLTSLAQNIIHNYLDILEIQLYFAHRLTKVKTSFHFCSIDRSSHCFSYNFVDMAMR